MTEVIIEYFWKQRSSPSVDMHSLVLQIAVDWLSEMTGRATKDMDQFKINIARWKKPVRLQIYNILKDMHFHRHLFETVKRLKEFRGDKGGGYIKYSHFIEQSTFLGGTAVVNI